MSCYRSTGTPVGSGCAPRPHSPATLPWGCSSEKPSVPKPLGPAGATPVPTHQQCTLFQKVLVDFSLNFASFLLFHILPWGFLLLVFGNFPACLMFLLSPRFHAPSLTVLPFGGAGSAGTFCGRWKSAVRASCLCVVPRFQNLQWIHLHERPILVTASVFS